MNNQSIYTKSRWNGWNGNECVDKKDFNKAIKYYNNAIELYPLEYRYFVNRSFCYDQIKRYDLALEDAMMAIMLNSDWGKCHFRKGRALRGLKRLQEAEVCFFKVMELEGEDCREAKYELLGLRKTAVINFGADHKTACDVANRSVDINEAIEIIKRIENFKSDEKSNDKHRNKMKKSNRDLSIKSKNSTFGRQNFYRSESNSNEINKIKANISLDSKSQQLSCMSSNAGKNVLKKLSDILLNTGGNNQIENFTNKEPENVEYSQNGSLMKTEEEKNDQKCQIDENKSLKSFSSESVHSNDSKPRNAYNRRNNRRNYYMDQIVEIWDDSKERITNVTNARQHNIPMNDSIRNLEPTNVWKFKGLWISNIVPNEQTKKYLHQMFSEFGKVTLISLIPNTDSAIINYDNPESPRVAMSRLQGVYMPNICVQSEKLSIKFRPLNDLKNYPNINCVTERQLNNECYFWRTTGCNYFRNCKLKHIPANKGVDYQPWMQNIKPYKRQHRQRFETH